MLNTKAINYHNATAMLKAVLAHQPATMITMPPVPMPSLLHMLIAVLFGSLL